MDPSDLDAWAAEAAAAVGATVGDGDVAAVLDLARDAAHGIARGRGLPLAEVVAALTAAIERRSA
jgi:hypothetical protein